MTNRVKIPAKMKLAVDRELSPHLEAHLQSEHLNHIRTAKRHADRQKSARKDGHRIIGAFRIYSSDLASVARSGVGEPHAGGWVLLAQTAPGLLAKIEIRPHNKEFRVVRVVTGAVAEEMDRALRKLLAHHQKQTRELRFLSLPGMHVMALWSHFSKHPQKDLISPISLNFAGLRQRRTYSRAAAEKLLRRHAVDLIVHWYERYQREAQQPTAEVKTKTGH